MIFEERTRSLRYSFDRLRLVKYARVCGVVLVLNCVCTTHACNELSVKNMLLLWTLAVVFLWSSSRTTWPMKCARVNSEEKELG